MAAPDGGRPRLAVGRASAAPATAVRGVVAACNSVTSVSNFCTTAQYACPA